MPLKENTYTLENGMQVNAELVYLFDHLPDLVNGRESYKMFEAVTICGNHLIEISLDDYVEWFSTHGRIDHLYCRRV